jgi:hypothetical protein
VTLAVTGNTIFGRVFKLQGDGVQGASSAVDRKSRGHTVGELQWKDPDFLCIFLYLALQLWKSVVTLA